MNTTSPSTRPGDLVGRSLLKVQIGPVQEFIAQARSTRDLWSGSYLLSWLMATALEELRKSCASAEVIMPTVADQPLCSLHANGKCPRDGDAVEPFLVPSLPNIMLAEVPEDGAAALAEAIKVAVRREWDRIATEVWTYLALDSDEALERRFFGQTRRFLSITWQVTPHFPGEDWTSWVTRNGRDLAAVRETRDFEAWAEGGWNVGRESSKDSLTGREEGIVFTGYRPRRPELSIRFKHPDTLGAVTLVKRVWDLAYLKAKCNLPPLRMANTQGVACHDPYGKNNPAEDEPSDSDTAPYFAVLAFDGDRMGLWASGEKHRPQDAGKSPLERTRIFSSALKRFAVDRVESIVRNHDGRLIYAGGDDVLALLPADTVLYCAEDLRTEFRMPEVLGPKADASVGIAIAHPCTPLQDVVRAAQDAEHRAKHQFGRSAVAVTISKRSGEITEWGFNWDDGGLEFYKKLGDALNHGHFSAKFPHRLIEILNRYKIATSPLIAQAPHIVDDEGFAKEFDPLVALEFVFVASRQKGSKPADAALIASFCNAGKTGTLDDFLTKLSVPPDSKRRQLAVQEKLARITNLLSAAAFHQRKKSEFHPTHPTHEHASA